MTRDDRCGQQVRRRDQAGIAVTAGQVCARRAGHPGGHRSSMALARQSLARQAPSGSPVVAAAVRQARVAAGMSQRRLAAVLGVTETAIQHWEYARRTPGEQSWVQLELALGPLGVVREAGPRPEAAVREADRAA